MEMVWPFSTHGLDDSCHRMIVADVNAWPIRCYLPILWNHPHLRLFVAGFSCEPWQALLAGEQFLHGTLFDLAFFGDELLQGFDEGIRIAQGLGDGFLFGFGRWEGDDHLV